MTLCPIAPSIRKVLLLTVRAVMIKLSWTELILKAFFGGFLGRTTLLSEKGCVLLSGDRYLISQKESAAVKTADSKGLYTVISVGLNAGIAGWVGITAS